MASKEKNNLFLVKMVASWLKCVLDVSNKCSLFNSLLICSLYYSVQYMHLIVCIHVFNLLIPSLFMRVFCRMYFQIRSFKMGKTDLPTAPEYPEHLLKSMFAPPTPRVRKFTPLKPYFPPNSRRSANFSAISFSPFAFERKRII